MMNSSILNGKNLNTFDTEEEMMVQLRSYINACPNVTVLENGYSMDLGFFILYENKGF